LFSQALVQDKDQGFVYLSQAVESGEKLYPNTSAEGREIIRQHLRTLKQDWDGLYDEVLSIQRHLEVNLVQWTSFEESYEQLEAWLRNMETQLSGEMPLHASLDEKKGQLQTYKVTKMILL
jgi:nesprin-1